MNAVLWLVIFNVLPVLLKKWCDHGHFWSTVLINFLRNGDCLSFCSLTIIIMITANTAQPFSSSSLHCCGCNKNSEPTMDWKQFFNIIFRIFPKLRVNTNHTDFQRKLTFWRTYCCIKINICLQSRRSWSNIQNITCFV